MKMHELKTWPQYFEAILSGEKTFEVRNNDRDFKKGDILWLREYAINKNAEPPHENIGFYTGRQLTVQVLYVYAGNGIMAGYCVMSIKILYTK